MLSTGKTRSGASSLAFRLTLLIVSVSMVWSNGLANDSLNVSLISTMYESSRFPELVASAVSGNYLYAMDQETGMTIFDISTPASPRPVGKYSIQGGAMGIQIVGQLCYLAGFGVESLIILDLTDPLHPEKVGSGWFGGYGRGVSINGDYCYITVSSEELKIIDIRDPSQLALVGSIALPGVPVGLVYDAGFCFITNRDGGRGQSRLYVVDVRDPAAPQLVGRSASSLAAIGIAKSGDNLFLGCGNNGLIVYNVRDPADPIYNGSAAVPMAKDVVIVGNICYVTSTDSGLYVLDIENFNSPRRIGYCQLPGLSVAVELSQGRAFIADAYGALRVVDVREPTRPASVGSYILPGPIIGVEYANGLCYVLSAGGFMTGTLRIVDVSDLRQPVELGYYELPLFDNWVDELTGLTYRAPYCYVSQLDYGVSIVDVSDPANPAFVGRIDTPGYARRVALSVNDANEITVVVPDYSRGIQICDVTNPRDPRILSELTFGTRALQADIAGDYCYVADQDSGVRIIDISDPRNPQLIATYEVQFGVYSVAIKDNYCYAGTGRGAMVVWDVSDPANPRVVARDYRAGTPRDFAFSGEFCYVASAGDGMLVYDVSNPDTIWRGGYYRDQGCAASAVAADAGIAFVAQGAHLAIYDCREALGIEEVSDPAPSHFILNPVYPNPFNGTSNISFTLPGDDVVTIGVYNLRGELTERVFHGRMTAGSHQLDWNAHTAPAGVYWVRMMTNSGFNASERVVLLK